MPVSLKVWLASGIALSLPVEALAAPPAAKSLFPVGGGRGQVVDVTADGAFDPWPVQTWSSEPGLVIEPGSEKGKFTIRVAEDALPGLRWIRFSNNEGASVPVPFEIGTTPAVVEAEPNDELAKAQVQELPCTIDGRLGKRGDVDAFAVSLEKGQTLVASLKGQRLGSPMDAVLQVTDRDGFVLQQSEDEIGLDPQLAFEAREQGEYIVRCFAFPSEPNSTIGFAGGDDYRYRLTLTIGAFVDHTLPLAVSSSDATQEVEALGWNLNDSTRELHTEPVTTDVVRSWNPDAAGIAMLPVVPWLSVIEATSKTEPQLVPVPVTISGRVSAAGEQDVYRFAAVKGQKLNLRVAARSLGSPLDAVLRVFDAEGKNLAEQDDRGRSERDPALRFDVPSDGEYRVVVSDLTGQAGQRYFYRLDITEPVPDYTLSVAENQITVASGKPATINVTVNRIDGFDVPIALSVSGLPDGVEAAAAVDEPPSDSSSRSERRRGSNSKPVAKLTISMKDDAAAFSGPVKIIGRAERDGEMLERVGVTNLAVPGATMEPIWLTVVAASDDTAAE